MPEVSILLVGDTHRREFIDARAALKGSGRIVAAANAQAAAAALAQATPDLIVLAQAFPGEFSREVVNRLRRLAPLARVVGLLGSWCEGETRTGRPCPATIRIYWHQWSPQAEREIGQLRDGACSTWALPVTAGDEERLLRLADEPLPAREGLIAISTADFEMQDWLCSACKQRGYSAVWLRPDRPMRAEGAAAAIFDCHQCQGDELQLLGDLAATLGPAPIVALLSFPRTEDRDRALEGGASAVLSKPLLVDDLFWQIDRLLGREQTGCHC